MELLNEIDDLLFSLDEKIDKRKRKPAGYKLKEREIKIIEEVEPESLVFDLNLVIYSKFGPSYTSISNPDHYLENLLSMKIFRLEQFVTEDKEWVKSVLLEKAESYSQINSYRRFFPDYVHPTKDRLRLVTEGKNIHSLIFLTPEQEKQFTDYFRNIGKEMIHYYINNRSFDSLKRAFCYYYEKEYYEATDLLNTDDFHTLKELIALSSLERGTDSIEELNEMKQLCIELFRKYPFPLFDESLDELEYYDVISYIYLLNDKEKEKYKIKVTKRFEKLFDIYKNSNELSDKERKNNLLSLRHYIKDFQINWK